MRLAPCSHCRRHVSSEASSCPFCGTKTAWHKPVSLSRSSRFVLGTLGASLAISCGSVSASAFYGAACIPPELCEPPDAASDDAPMLSVPPDSAPPDASDAGPVDGAPDSMLDAPRDSADDVKAD
jgi:hypothetical protein